MSKFEEYVYDPNKKVSLGEEIAKANETWQKMMKALNERDFDTANKIAEDNHFNCRFSAKSFDCDKPQKDLSKESVQPSVWRDPKKEKPEDGEMVLIYGRRRYTDRKGIALVMYRHKYVTEPTNGFGTYTPYEDDVKAEKWLRIPPIE